ncbi:MAG: hypothetical protein AAGD32_11040 [Planctomycetota bacterium]
MSYLSQRMPAEFSIINLLVWIVPLLLALVLGLILLTIGMRGRRVGDHPYCRQCGYDLFGNPDAMTCNECGRSVASPQERVVGMRHRRRGLVWGGTLLLIVSVVGQGLIGLDAATDVDWQAWKPNWWLVAEADRNPDVHLTLATRWFDGKLTEKHKSELVALAFAGSDGPSWSIGWEPIIEQGLRDGLLDDEQLAVLADTIAVLGLDARPKVRRGFDADVVPWPVKGTDVGDIELHASWTLAAAAVDGEPVNPNRLRSLDGDFEVKAGSWGGSASHIPTEAMTRDTTVTATARVERTLILTGGTSVGLPTKTAELAVDVEVVDDFTGNYTATPRQVSAIDTIEVQPVAGRQKLELMAVMRGNDLRLWRMLCFLVIDGQEIRIPDTNGSGHGSQFSYVRWSLERSSRWDKTPELAFPLMATVVLRTDIEYVETNTRTDEIAPSVELRFENVRLDPASAVAVETFTPLPDGQAADHIEWLDPAEALRRNEAAE